MATRSLKIRSKGNIVYDESQMDSLEKIVKEITEDLKRVPLTGTMEANIDMIERVTKFSQSFLNNPGESLPEELILLGAEYVDEPQVENLFHDLCVDYPKLKEKFETNPGELLTDSQQMIRDLAKILDEKEKDK